MLCNAHDDMSNFSIRSKHQRCYKQHQLYPLLEVEYDDPHRAHFLTNTDAEVPLPPLRPRTHTSAHQWDERYAPYIRRAGFLELVCVVNYGLPPLDPALLTAAVDR